MKRKIVSKITYPKAPIITSPTISHPPFHSQSKTSPLQKHSRYKNVPVTKTFPLQNGSRYKRSRYKNVPVTNVPVTKRSRYKRSAISTAYFPNLISPQSQMTVARALNKSARADSHPISGCVPLF